MYCTVAKVSEQVPVSVGYFMVRCALYNVNAQQTMQ